MLTLLVGTSNASTLPSPPTTVSVASFDDGSAAPITLEDLATRLSRLEQTVAELRRKDVDTGERISSEDQKMEKLQGEVAELRLDFDMVSLHSIDSTQPS